MRITITLATLVFSTLSLHGCTKGKECLCEKFDKETGAYEGSKYTEDFDTCTGAAFVLSNEDPYYYYDCYDYYQK